MGCTCHVCFEVFEDPQLLFPCSHTFRGPATEAFDDRFEAVNREDVLNCKCCWPAWRKAAAKVDSLRVQLKNDGLCSR